MKPRLYNVVIEYAVRREEGWSNPIVNRNQVKAFGAGNAQYRARMGLRLRLTHSRTITDTADLRILKMRVAPAASGV